jgi:hypothetical protein
MILFGINPSVPANSADWILVERFESQQQLARDGKVQAMYEVGRMYERGRGTAVNFSRAAEWYQKASDAGNVAAKARLGILYYEGRGIPQNHQQAYQLLNEAAGANIPAAQYHLGLMYEHGAGVKQDTNEAMKWYQKAMQGGDYRAKHKLDALGSQQDKKPRSASRSNDSNIIPALLNAKWHAGARPAGILPSEISQCEPFKRGLKCHSEQQRSTGTETITYETAATISDVHKQSFTITYYNTVLKVISQTPANTTAESETPPIANSIKVGQKSPEHRLDCQLKNKRRINCNKDKIRNVSFSSK